MFSSPFRNIMARSTVAGPAPEPRILAAEARLSLRFPSEYRDFLKEFGAVLGVGFELAGIFTDEGPGPPLWRDVVGATESFRKAVKGQLPDSLLAISDDGSEIAYYIDASAIDKGDCQVLAYGPGLEGGVVARSLDIFVVRLSEGEL